MSLTWQQSPHVASTSSATTHAGSGSIGSTCTGIVSTLPPTDGDEEDSHYLLLMASGASSALPPVSSLLSSSASVSQASTVVGPSSASPQHELATTIIERDYQMVLDGATSNETKKVLVQYFHQHPMLKSFVAGSLSGTCSTLLFQPFDLLKTRIQNANFATTISPAGSATVASGSSAITAPVHSNRIGAILVDVVKNEQLLGLWRGTVPSLMRCVPGVGLHFCCLDTLQSHFCAGRQPRAGEALVFGAASRSLAGVLLIPVTVVKTRYESGVFVYKSITDALRHTYQFEGIRGLTSGLAPTLMRDVPFSGLYYMFYTQLKAFLFPLCLAKSNSPSSSSPSASSPSLISSSFVTFACGINAGLLASVTTQPMDVVKTHMQLYPKQFPSSLSTVIFIVKQKGAQGLFSGLVPRMMRRTLMASMAWTVYEQMMKNIGLK